MQRKDSVCTSAVRGAGRIHVHASSERETAGKRGKPRIFRICIWELSGPEAHGEPGWGDKVNITKVQARPTETKYTLKGASKERKDGD